jgi:RES domain-containing protein
VTSCFRLSSGRYASDAGIGAALQGGRWNPKGVEVVYAAATVSLAALEVLVQFSVLPRDFVLTKIHIPAGVVIEAVHEQDLPTDWRHSHPPRPPRKLADRLELPSVADLWYPAYSSSFAGAPRN